MIWGSVFWMTAIDVIVITAASLAILVFFRHYELITQLHLTFGAGSVLLAMEVIAVFHFVDLLLLHKVIVSSQNSISALNDWHLNWGPVENLISVGSITAGFVFLAHRLLPQTVSSLAAVREAEQALRAKNEELEVLVEQRVAQLLVINEELENEIRERAEAETQIRYQARLLKNVSDAVISTDKDFHILSWNEGAEQIYGWTAEEVIGRDVLALFQTTYPGGEPTAEAWAHFHETGEWVGEAVHIGKHGQKIDVFISSSPVLDEAGQMVGAVGVMRDITEHKKTRATLAKEHNILRALLDNLLDFVFIKDRDSRFILANRAIATFMGVDSPDDLIGKTDGDFYPQEEAARFRTDELHIMETGEAVINKYESDTSLTSGEKHMLLTTKLPYRDVDGEIIGTIGVGRDVTALSEAERLRIDNEKLEIALDKERELSKLKVDFMATVAHEFRTPLTVILTSSSMLNRYWQRMDDDARRKKLANIESQVVQLANMLDELSVSIQADRGKLSFSPQWVSVPEICQRLEAEIEPLLTDGVELIVNVPEKMDALYLDDELFYRMLLKLASNAIKYSPNGGPVALTLSTTEDQLTVSVEDHGIGIPDDDQDRLLDPFFRGSNVGTIRGTGSGLSVVKEIVDLHSGNIHIRSQLDQGTTFTITLPISQNGG